MGVFSEILGILRSVARFLSERRILGMPADSLLHFLGGGAIVYFCQKEYGWKVAWTVLWVATLAKEFVDIFVHSGMSYGGSWTLDTTADVVCGLAGGAIASFMLSSAGKKDESSPPPPPRRGVR
jgi:hypothetical protein